MLDRIERVAARHNIPLRYVGAFSAAWATIVTVAPL